MSKTNHGFTRRIKPVSSQRVTSELHKFFNECSKAAFSSKDNLLSEVMNYLNTHQIKHTIRTGSEIFEVFTPFLKSPTWWTGFNALLKSGKILIDDGEVYTDAYFQGDEWSNFYSRDFSRIIVDALSGYPTRSIKTIEEHSVIKLVDVEGSRFGWVQNTKFNSVERVYADTDTVDIAQRVIKRLLWEKYHTQSLVMRKLNVFNMRGGADANVLFEVDDSNHPLPSALATRYSKYLQRCIDAGYNRSVILYGPPGTGKSTMARTLIENLKMRSFRIRVSDLAHLDGATLFEAISIFEPDALILDDLDRAHDQISLLETLEHCKRHVKLIIATVNDRSQLDAALLRPGRFDEHVLVDAMDERVIKHMLGKFVDGYDTVKSWPIVFIQEYVQRRTFMTPEEAARSTVELAQRVEQLSRYRDIGAINSLKKAVQCDDELKHVLDSADEDSAPEVFEDVD